ncbi:dual specificity protein phosphatase CDC14AB-like [Cottoperca gobio]|uniref:Dual specificity protein phosphatase CDC14AB-like n=1 Tax=Cottoperca gobio TaxID=56716 RepID=A0A6J2PBK0_COTGO|nr:dual specificity protein phosphatase CDC14AB-like [Cottoperca gobio]
MGGGQGPPSPLKSSKFPSSASAAAKRIGRSPASTASNIRSSRLASSLSDLYVDVEDASPPPPSAVSLSSSPSHMAPPPLCRYGNGPRSTQHEVNNNGGGPYADSVAPSGRIQDLSPYRVSYSALRGRSGTLLERDPYLLFSLSTSSTRTTDLT